jgi:diaminopimelate epimerase
MKIPFVKMQGLGNDFVLIDAIERKVELASGQITRLCDRRFGVGADQVLIIAPSEIADCRMRVFNADGGEVEMCGNGIRCLARYLVGRTLARDLKLRIETLAGVMTPTVEGERVTVDMGRPEFDSGKIPTTLAGRIVDREVTVGGEVRRITCLSMGNPHCVLYVDDLDRCPVAEVGPKIENDPLFPKRVNVEFVKVISGRLVAVRVWERGSGETMACGTGACAAAVAGCLTGKNGRDVAVRLPGGELRIQWRTDDHVLMTGPAEEVFRGEIDF